MAEQSLGEFNKSEVLDFATDSILVTSTDLSAPGPSIIYANRAFELMTGWTLSEIVGNSPRLLQGEKTDLSIFKDMRQVLEAGDVWQGQAVNYRKDRSEFVMEWSISAIPGQDGQPKYYVAVQRDVTSRVEKETQLNEALLEAAEANRKRINLSRYFSPQTAQHLAEKDDPLGLVRRQKVAVLFIDIEGSTAMAEKLGPERVMAVLRSFYSRMAKRIFTHHGSIEHFAGDSLLAVFGAPDQGPDDATRALICATAMSEELGRWNRKRLSEGRDEIIADITVHYGDVVLGDIGVRESMSFTVIGDTVNTTSRLQELCRKFNKRVLVSEKILLQAETEGYKGWRKCYRIEGDHKLRGREKPISIFSAVLEA